MRRKPVASISRAQVPPVVARLRPNGAGTVVRIDAPW